MCVGAVGMARTPKPLVLRGIGRMWLPAILIEVPLEFAVAISDRRDQFLLGDRRCIRKTLCRRRQIDMKVLLMRLKHIVNLRPGAGQDVQHLIAIAGARMCEEADVDFAIQIQVGLKKRLGYAEVPKPLSHHLG